MNNASSFQTRPYRCMRRLTAVGVVAVLMVSCLSAQLKTDYIIPMSDGVLLDASLTLPDSSVPHTGFPVVLLIHGYGGNKGNWSGVETYLTSLGFGSFTYSVRGQGNSGGFSTTMGEREQADLLEVIQFLRSLSGVDRDRLAVAGGSQGGIHAWMAAVHHMPGVRVIASLIGPPSFAHDLLPNGCIKQQLWAELNLASVRYDPVRDRLRDFVISDRFDSVLAYVASRDLEGFLDSVKIPVFQSLGWADVLFPTNSAIRAVDRLSSRGVPVWSYFGTNGHGELNLVEYYYVIIDLIAPWFNRWLKGDSLDRSGLPLVVYADDRPTWPHHESLGWPPALSSTLRLFLSGEGRLTTLPSELLSSTFTVSYDSTYTPAQGWADGYSGTGFTNAFHAQGVQFLSTPLADSLEMTGIPLGLLQLRSDASKFQAHMRIFDVAPPESGGGWTLVTRGAVGVRNNTPGTSLERSVECQALSHIISPGHRVGVEITSLDMYNSTRPHIVPFFNSATSIVQSSQAAASYIDIPIVGNATFTSAPLAEAQVPTEYALLQNFPNPFNPSTVLSYLLPAAGDVVLDVYDMLGREVRRLVDERMSAGVHRVDFDGTGLASGMYIYRLTVGGRTIDAKRMILIK